MKRTGVLFLILFITVFKVARSQDDAEVKSLKAKVEQASGLSQRVNAYFDLADYYFLSNTTKSDSIAFQAVAMAEASRDRALMVTTYIRDGARFLKIVSKKENINEALARATKAQTIARQLKDPDLIVGCHTFFARVYRGAGESEKALKANNEAMALLPEVKDDSVKVYAYNSMGRSQRVKRDMLSAFKSYLSALTIAEQSGRQSLLIACNRNLEEFYREISNFEKAKDYAFRTLHLDEKRTDKKAVIQDYMSIATIYAATKDLEMAKFYFDKAGKLADSLALKESKIGVNLGLVNMYLQNNRFKEGYAMLKDDPLIFNFLRDNGMQYEIDKANGYVQMMLGNYDSSFYYYKKSESFYATNATAYQRFYFYNQYSSLFKTLKQWKKAIEYEDKARAVIEPIGDLEALDAIVQDLDSLYYYSGDFKNAYNYQQLHQKYSDSLRKLSEQKDILSLEIDDENKRTERAKILEEQELAKRHNLQYMGITAAIASVFIVLVSLGFFKVSATVVKAIGFFAFIFLFEFIILILDNQIHHLTHGEPWKVLAIKIVLIAMLLPLHHWLEEKVIHYLIEHRLLTPKLSWLKSLKKDNVQAGD